MASEGVAALEGSQATFFHASFFDYAFARGFIGRGEELVAWLKADGQDLFRRSQTRQVLEFLRDDDPEIYLETLSRLLADKSVRFHLKRLALDWLGQLAEPRAGEWQVLTEQDERLDGHVIGSVRNNVHWFDLLHRLGVLKAWLTSERKEDRSKALLLLRMSNILEDRSSAAGGLLRTVASEGQANKQDLLMVMSIGTAYRSREMMDLFLELVDDGTLDEARGFAMNSDWWSVLYQMSTAKPDYCSEAIGHWLDRQCKLAGGPSGGARPVPWCGPGGPVEPVQRARHQQLLLRSAACLRSRTSPAHRTVHGQSGLHCVGARIRRRERRDHEGAFGCAPQACDGGPRKP